MWFRPVVSFTLRKAVAVYATAKQETLGSAHTF